ncbi:MAG: molybdopterin molybdotransferase MoeA [Bacteroidetes bacterium]|nr:molybdopterin molybdotransferase MoeA [Bacteroidota bacterium]
MVTVEEALALIAENCRSLPVQHISLESALNRVLASAIFAPIHMPPFRQSAMDGYALNYTESIHTYTLIGEVAAGSGEAFILKPGDAVRIFTGAAVPDFANVVAQQEIVNRAERTFTLTAPVKPGQNIRLTGEQIKKGELALPKDTLLGPAAIGYLATLGIEMVDVIATPKIGLLTTGNELVKPGSELKPGQIYESNSAMISAVLQNYNFEKPERVKVKDDLKSTREALEKLIAKNDVILISGGISVGDYDFVKTALENLNVQQQFYKVKQKPGKPIFFGTKTGKLIFALPGNPASALTCLYIYVLPALYKLSGKNFSGLQQVKRKLSTTYQKKAGLAHFLKSNAGETSVKISDSQSSAMLNSFALANGLIYIPESVETIPENTLVDVYLF